MIYISDLQNLVSNWLERMNDSSQPSAYKDAVNDCVYDLNGLIDKFINEECNAMDYLDSIEADNFLSSLEAHEAVA